MAIRALAVWFLLLILAVLNGGVRDRWLSPRLGDTVGRAISTLLLSGLILLATWGTIGWIRPGSSAHALRVGALWLGLTLAFEFLVGHYGFGRPWPELLADYDVRNGRIWIVVLIATLLAPWLTARWRSLV
jgi:hypothetical protein